MDSERVLDNFVMYGLTQWKWNICKINLLQYYGDWRKNSSPEMISATIFH